MAIDLPLNMLTMPRFYDGRAVPCQVVISHEAHRQPQSPLFRLPVELRQVIYKAALPTIRDWQHVYSNHLNERERFWRFWRNPCYACDSPPPAEGKASPELGCYPRPVVQKHTKAIYDQTSHFECDSEGMYPERWQGSFKPSWMARSKKRGSPLPLLLTCRKIYRELMPLCNRAIVFEEIDTLHYFLRVVSDDVLGCITDLSIKIHFSSPALFRQDEPKRWREICDKLADLPGLQRVRIDLVHGVDEVGRLRHHFDEVMIHPLSQLAATVSELQIDRLTQAYFSPHGSRGVDQQEWRVLRPARDVPEDQGVSCDEPFKGLRTTRLLQGSEVPWR